MALKMMMKKQFYLKKVWKKSNKILYYSNLFYIFKIIKIELINKYHNNLLANYFKIKKYKNLY